MNSRSLTRALILVLGICLVPGFCFAAGPVPAGPVLTKAEQVAPGPPVDLTGNWYGTYKAGQDRGTASMVLEQSGITSGTFYGAAVSTTGAYFTMVGDYTVEGRKIVSGSVTVAGSGGYEFGGLKGKVSKTGTEMKLKMRGPDMKAKITLVRQ